MKRYFFDLVSGERSQYDYRGIVYPDHRKPPFNWQSSWRSIWASSPTAEWSGWTVDVYNAAR